MYGSSVEKPITIRIDPRVEVSESDLSLQNEYSQICYQGYLTLQEIREGIDAGNSNSKDILALRGSGAPSAPDVLYSSVYQSANGEETIVGLQRKFLYLMKVLQGADARPTTQAINGVSILQESLKDIQDRWEKLK